MTQHRPARTSGRSHRSGPTARITLAVAVMLAAIAAVAAPEARGAPPLALFGDPLEATNSSAARQNAIQSIPVDKLDAESRARVQSVLSNVTIFRRLPVRVIDCDPHLYLFLVRHPDVVVNIWEVLQLSSLQLRRTSEGKFDIVEEEGSVGELEFLYQSHDTHVAMAEGTYLGPLLRRPVRGRCLLVLKTGYVLGTDGRHYISSRLDTFVSVDPGGVELLTKAVQPVIGKMADHNFTQTAAFVGSLSRTAEVNSEGVQRLASRLMRVQPEQRQQFAQLAAGVGQRVSTAETPVPRPPALMARQQDAPPRR